MSPLSATPTDPALLRQAFGCFPSGVTAVCALESGSPVGMAASTFTPVSLSPALMSVCMQDTSATWPRLRRRSRVGVSVLAEGQDAICRSLASKHDRFASVDWDADENGGVYIHGASLWLTCSLHAELPGGDHTIVLLEIHGLKAEPDREPLVFHNSRFRRLAI
ncbi:flavin reductase family protein [Nocardia sp. NEAU-G5]|uniref:Flavin reductase family protein n=1 Tax=Nocardia albiluteola TaxID=2842303 RepID=A0ABS6AYQ4_9NOCA|nr:flavin reductase family protein [Nocardia albiluteola]MBU3063177.1 flavin reductase family protein [Nocardia albiluteola]